MAFAAASLLIVLRMYVLVRVSGNMSIVPRSKLLMGTTSIAIWNGNKLAIALASGVWVANLGFLAQSKTLHPVFC